MIRLESRTDIEIRNLEGESTLNRLDAERKEAEKNEETIAQMHNDLGSRGLNLMLGCAEFGSGHGISHTSPMTPPQFPRDHQLPETAQEPAFGIHGFVTDRPSLACSGLV